MEKEVKSNTKGKEQDFVLQWGNNRKRHRCVKVKNNISSPNNNSNNNTSSSSRLVSDSLGKKKVVSSSGVVNAKKESCPRSPNIGLNKNSETMNKRKATSPEKEDRCYTTRGSVGADENGKVLLDHHVKNDKATLVWPKLFLSLSSKEKEEDFMAMKGCKLPQRPKKRAKLIQRSILLVCPGTWLSDVSLERYEVREKKTSKKKPRGLKAMGGMESESE